MAAVHRLQPDDGAPHGGARHQGLDLRCAFGKSFDTGAQRVPQCIGFGNPARAGQTLSEIDLEAQAFFNGRRQFRLTRDNAGEETIAGLGGVPGAARAPARLSRTTLSRGSAAALRARAREAWASIHGRVGPSTARRPSTGASRSSC